MPESPLHFFLATRVFFGKICRAQEYFGSARVVVPRGTRFGSVNRPENTRGDKKKRVRWDFGKRKFEYEVSSCLASRNGDLYKGNELIDLKRYTQMADSGDFRFPYGRLFLFLGYSGSCMLPAAKKQKKTH